MAAQVDVALVKEVLIELLYQDWEQLRLNAPVDRLKAIADRHINLTQLTHDVEVEKSGYKLHVQDYKHDGKPVYAFLGRKN